MTNALVDRYGFAWVGEDWGSGRSRENRPTPRARGRTRGPRRRPSGTRASFARASRRRSSSISRDSRPRCARGPIHAYDFFRAVAEEADVAVAFDTAKLLAYQWQRDRRGADLFGELERLPLDRCYEIHVSGRDAKSGRSFGGPSDTLFEAQLGLVERLAGLCPNVRVIAYEGPLFGAGGTVAKTTTSALARLEKIVGSRRSGRPSGSAPAEVREPSAS